MRHQARHALWQLLWIGLVGCGEQQAAPLNTVEVTKGVTGEVTIPESNLNRDWRTRDAILGISVKWGKDDVGGTFHFEQIDLSVLEKLLEKNFIDPADQQNEGPTVSEIVQFMRTHPGTVGFGYAVSPERPDYRVSIEGIMIARDKVTTDTREAAKSLCHDADEAVFELDIYCWWD